MIRIAKGQVVALHSQLIQETGGINGIRDEGLLDSAPEAPFQGFSDKELYPSLQQKAARLGYGLIMNTANSFCLSFRYCKATLSIEK